MLLSHFFHEIRKIWKGLRIHREILIALHVIDVQVDTVQRNVEIPVSFYYLTDIILAFVPPSALSISKRPEWRNVAASDQTAELPDNILYIRSGNHIHIQVPV